MKKKLLIGSFVFASLILGACGASENKNQANNDKIKVVATFYPMYEFTKAVVGEAGEVELLIPAGTEAHDYEPSAKAIAKMSEADAIVYNSHEFETWMENATSNFDQSKMQVIEASRAIELMPLGEMAADHAEEGDSHVHHADPHVWLDPVLAKTQVETIREALSEQFPEKKTVFSQQAQSYLTQLEQLDRDIQAAFANAQNRTFVTQHAAFSYFAKRYDLTQESIAGLSSEEEPSPSRLAELKHFVQDHQISVIYFEDNASSKVAQTLAKETGVELAVLSPIESLTKEQQAAGENYLSTMRKNLEALQLSIH